MQPTTVAAPALVAVAVVCAGAAVVTGAHHDSHAQPRAVAPAASAPSPAVATATSRDIARLQQRLRDVPRDWESWAALGLDYVQQAKVTVDPTYYPKAQGALARSLHLQATDNVIATAGEAALAAARHDFRTALGWAQRGLRVDPSSAVLYGALDDALTQLGRYREAARAGARMEQLDPGTSAEARLSYAAELCGDVGAAVGFMRLALGDAGSADDVAFTRYYLGDLELNSGQAREALAQFRAGLAADPAYVALLEGRARAEAALGDTASALRDFARVTDEVPSPTYLVEYGELLQSVGNVAAARDDYALVRAEEQLFRANGVALDSDATLFEADHGSVRAAVSIGRAAIVSRPFLDSYDAYAWALHRAGHDSEALGMSDRALSTGMHNALFRYHRGTIELALGRTAAGRADLRAALAINPDFNPLAAPVARRLLATR